MTSGGALRAVHPLPGLPARQALDAHEPTPRLLPLGPKLASLFRSCLVAHRHARFIITVDDTSPAARMRDFSYGAAAWNGTTCTPCSAAQRSAVGPTSQRSTTSASPRSSRPSVNGSLVPAGSPKTEHGSWNEPGRSTRNAGPVARLLHHRDRDQQTVHEAQRRRAPAFVVEGLLTVEAMRTRAPAHRHEVAAAAELLDQQRIFTAPGAWRVVSHAQAAAGHAGCGAPPGAWRAVLDVQIAPSPMRRCRRAGTASGTTSARCCGPPKRSCTPVSTHPSSIAQRPRCSRARSASMTTGMP